MTNNYILESNQKIAKFKKTCSYVLIFIVILYFVVSATGCGSAPAGNKGGSGSSSGNKILIYNEDENEFELLTGNGKYESSSFYLFASSARLNPRVDYGINSKKSGTIVRDVAIMLHNSVFDNKYGAAGDYFANSNTFQPFSLNPAKLIKSVNSTTISAMNSNGVMSSLTGLMQGFAATILISMWAMGFVSQIINEKFTAETLLKTFMQLICGILLITNSTFIVQAFSAAGNVFVDSVNASGSLSFNAFEQDIRNNYLLKGPSSINFGIALFKSGTTIYFDIYPAIAIALMAYPAFAMIGCAYKIVSMMITRMLELTLRITFAPIPIAFAAQSGFSQEAIRYFRSVLACAIQPALMIVGCMFVGTIGDVISEIFGGSSGLTGIVGSIATGLSYTVLSAFLNETRGLAKEIIAR